ncbi:ABC transporter ATP-binding protein [Rubrimonas cliftonensis]|uniref:Peptide/nickel transport system ATP-binding protein/dipeptide transport system ATP-binding protein n=1 Tax=Rubrimonas cliftonensis TaxID=89524 RepID=A0A1H4G387_9RHOB|nr:ABC transporter ATP-binding protein [Rubrimonas cliftonensis]SEB03877.1 peptide/nickel transport system ATP-binding protein/dipeptide transport system ATP-binding protein [Rubrimonas cliftonensis]
MAEPLLSARGVTVTFATRAGPRMAVRGVDLDVAAGETVAIVGESGSGKSAFARAVLRQHQPPFTRSRVSVGGSILLGRAAGPVDLAQADARALRAVRAREIAMVFQEAMSALNPVMRIGRQVAEAARAAEPGLSRAAADARAAALLERMGVADAARRARDFPHQLSGGQRQRVMIAIAAARRPRLLIADEPTTALDVTVQARLLALLAELKRESGMAMLFITHDLGVVRRIADRVAVMYAGRLIELAPAATFFARPRHPYAAALLDSAPGRGGAPLAGRAPEPWAAPEGCAFHPRCPAADATCRREPPQAQTPAGWARCWRPVA